MNNKIEEDVIKEESGGETEGDGEIKAEETSGASENPKSDDNSKAEEASGAGEDQDAAEASDTGEDQDAVNGNMSEKDGADNNASGKNAKKDSKDILIEELQDKYRRQIAEFDNFRKRTEKEKSAMYDIGAKDVIEKILPIVDNFERGFESISDEERTSPFASGMDKVYRQLAKALEDMGVKPIDAVGQEFNPDYHNAVVHVEDEDVGENIVVEELQRGYTYRDSVVRHSMVKVAN